MPLPIRNLPVVQNWDCHVCGDCCKQYIVSITAEERQKIEAHSWAGDEVVAGMPIFRRKGSWWSRQVQLNHRPDGSCVFLSQQGRCRIHEVLGYDAKPLPCRLFPFVMVPVGDHWRVGMRFACPSTAANKGRNIQVHLPALRQFAQTLIAREKLEKLPGLEQRPPPLRAGQRVPWSDLLRFVRVLVELVGNEEDRLELRLRKCVAMAQLCRQARYGRITGGRLEEFLRLVVATVDAETPIDPAQIPAPGWVGRLLFRQAAALFTRKDHGPDRGLAAKGRLALLWAAWRYVRGSGAVPRMHAKMTPATFEEIEATHTELTPEAEKILERYYAIKIESMQFCGAANMGLPFWEGLEVLCLTLPIVLWTMRALKGLSREDACCLALTIVDDHFGYNRVLKTYRQRVSFNLLARTDELTRLIAWYAR